METRRFVKFTFVCVLLSGLFVCPYSLMRVEGARNSGKKLVFDARSREAVSDGTGPKRKSPKRNPHNRRDNTRSDSIACYSIA